MHSFRGENMAGIDFVRKTLNSIQNKTVAIIACALA